MRVAGKLASEVLDFITPFVKPGITTDEIDKLCHDYMVNVQNTIPAPLNYAPDGHTPYPKSICTSINHQICHGVPGPKALKEGDIVSIDLGLTHKGLITDAAITIPVGKISKELEQLLDITKKALYAGIKVARGGKRIGDIGNAISRVALPYGYGIVEELAGHGVGYSVHEDPYVPNFGEEGKGEILKPGMVLAIEPMFNIGTKNIKLDKDGYTYRTADGSASAHFEHTIVITKSGAEILTQ